MSAYPLLILLVLFIVVMTVGLYGLSMVASKIVTRAVQDRLHALQQITEGKVPDVWLKPFRRRAATLRKKAAGDAQFKRLGQRIQKLCLRNLDEMTRYVTSVNMTDSETTHREVIALLKAYQRAWTTKDWRAWIADVEALDTARATKTARNDVSSAD